MDFDVCSIVNQYNKDYKTKENQVLSYLNTKRVKGT